MILLHEKPRAELPTLGKIYDRRPYQEDALWHAPDYRMFSLVWARQNGKTTWLAHLAHLQMLKHRGITVTYVSASLLLGREIVPKEAKAWSEVLDYLEREDAAADLKLEVPGLPERDGGGWDVDALAELFESQRLEVRLWHDRTSYSRTVVIAPNAATARGWSGTVLLDEFGFIHDFQELFEAVEPIVSRQPQFRLVMTSTPPRDDTHYSYNLLTPPPDARFDVNPRGNWYTSQAGMPVHRVTIFDAHAAGMKLYDLETGAELTPEQHRKAALDRVAWERNYNVAFIASGTAAVGLLNLQTAQARGVNECACVEVEEESDFDRALNFLRGHLKRGAVGIGWDVATTEKQTSNPSALAVTEENCNGYLTRLVLVWRTADPDLAKWRARQVLDVVASRPSGGRARRLCVDASNERYFAAAVRREFSSSVPVEMVIGGEKIERPSEQPLNMKQYLGARLVGALEDNRLTLPPESYLAQDFRLVRRERGQFMCEPEPDGRHGDTFDAVKLSLWALARKGMGGAVPARIGAAIGSTL